MGALALSELREELSAILGSRSNLTPTRLNRWINFGYEEVTGAVEFDELTGFEPLAPVGYVAVVPDNTRVVLAVRSADRLLTWMPQIEWIRHEPDSVGATKHWTRIGDSIYLGPTSSTLDAVEALIIKNITPLSDDADVTEIPSTWDLAILFMSVSFAFSALDEMELGISWYNRGLAYMQSRAAEENRKLVRPGLGATQRPDLRLAGT